MLGILIGIIIGLIWYPAIIGFMELMATKTMKEYEKLVTQYSDIRIQNKLLLVIVFVIRIPLLLIILIPLSVHVIKLTNKESK